MSEPTFHSLRISALEHGRDFVAYAEEIGVERFDLEQKLLEHAAPSLVAVIGDRESGKTRLVCGLSETGHEVLPRMDSASTHRYFHHVDFPAIYQGMSDESSRIPLDSPQLKKLSYLEVRTQIDIQNVAYDQSVMAAEGIIFVINAKEPFSGTLWKLVELYRKSHEGRVLFCLTNTDQLNPKDIPVMTKHLREKITLSSHGDAPLIQIDYKDLFTFHEIRVFLEDNAVGERRWGALKELGLEFEKAFKGVEKILVQQRAWLEKSNSTSANLKDELLRLRSAIRVELLLRIDQLGGRLKFQADEILSEVRAKLTHREYLASLFRTETSLTSLQDGLETILSEALYEEVGAHYLRANELVGEHSETFFSKHKFLAQYCPEMKNDKASDSPFLLEKHIVKNEIQVVLRQLRLKPLFRQELSQIDQLTNLRLCLAMAFVTAAGVFGSFLFHTVGFILLGVAALVTFWCFWMRKRALDDFIDFLGGDWFLGVGPRLLEPMDKLSSSLVDYAMDSYGSCFVPYLDAVKEKQEIMPDRIRKGREIYIKNKRFLSHF